MVLQKIMDLNFWISARGRGNIRKKYDGNEICAFDLLTTVAGKLLLEGERTSNSSVEDRSAVVKDTTETVKEKEDTSLKEDPYNEGCQEQGFFISQIVSEAPVVNHCLSKSTDMLSGPASVITSSDCSEKLGSAEPFINVESKIENGNFSTKPEQEASGCGDFSSCTLGTESKKQVKINLSNDTKISTNKRVAICSSEFPDHWDRKHSMLVASDNTVKLSLSTDPDPFGSFSVIRNDVQLANKDDDEKSCGCTRRSTRNKAFSTGPHVGDWRMRKLKASKYWEVNPQSDDEGHANVDNETRHVYPNRKNGYTSEMSQRDFPFKKRKLYYCNSFSNSDGGSIDGICCSPTKDLNRDASGYSLASSGVKLKIKSFRVPELFVEIPENAIVGSLKRTVVEAVTAILGGGLRIGVVFQGKKVRDDKKTLFQVGISHDDKLDALGFTLEPSPSQASPPICSEGRPCSPGPTVIRNRIQKGTYNAFPDHPGTNLSLFIDSDHDSAPSPPDASQEKNLLCCVFYLIMPYYQICYCISIWCCDKWKTLVHTARISPQQRRGEPVPQELLDRVLIAHAYWSKQQATQQMKHQSGTRLLL
ncbi:unnamed protein product [Withania somnifera]